jgi:3-dehydroquinate synthase
MAVRVDLGSRSYTVHFDSLRHLPERMADAGLSPEASSRCLLVSDENVAAHYRSPLQTSLEHAGWTVRHHIVAPGESTKAPGPLQDIYDTALNWGIDRSTPVVALGGGVVGDLAGFAAATLLRGVPLVQCPTSLLAQVDASVGGKTAINHETGKNLIGAFYQPRVVCADPNTLDTLPMREWISGAAEMIKHALIASPELLAFLEDNLTGVLARKDRDAIRTAIERAVQIKADVVADDETEQGRRAILNFGHTFGHAVETVAGYGEFTHGEAVAIGMRAVLYLSHQRHPDGIDRERLDYVVRALPVEGDPAALEADAVFDAMQSDKKNEGDTVRFVLLREPGDAYVTGDIPRSDLQRAWEFACHEPADAVR